MSVVLPAIETDGSAGDSDDDFIRSLCRSQPSQHSLSQNSGHGVGGMSVQPAGAEDCQESSDEEWARTLCRGAGLAADGASRGHLDHIVGSRHPPAAQLEGPSPVARLGGPGTEVEHSHSSRERGPARGNITSGPSGAAVSRRGVVASRTPERCGCQPERCGCLPEGCGRQARPPPKVGTHPNQEDPTFSAWSDMVHFAESQRQMAPLHRNIGPLEDGCILLTGCLNVPTGDVRHLVGHAAKRLHLWRMHFDGPLIWKFGIAADPWHRFRNREFGYELENRWRVMDIIASAPSNVCRVAEILLIRTFGKVLGAQNQKPGGEGVAEHRTHECFVYCVVADVDWGVQRTLEIKGRKRSAPSASTGGSGVR